MSDDKLIEEAVAIASAEYTARRAQFLHVMGINPKEYADAMAAHEEYAQTIGELRPSSRTPLAQESFVAGYHWATVSAVEKVEKDRGWDE